MTRSAHRRPLYEQFTNIQKLGEFHAALRKRDALYGLQHQEMGDSPPRGWKAALKRGAENEYPKRLHEIPGRLRSEQKFYVE
jgi:hypothetical protein